jgi:formiminotetrahydrofolate cyclodeaminase
MARTRTIASIESDIVKKQEMPAKAKSRYDSLAKELKSLIDEKREIQAKEIMAAFVKSGKSYNEIMNFLDSRGK